LERQVVFHASFENCSNDIIKQRTLARFRFFGQWRPRNNAMAAAQAGGQPYRVFSADENSRSDDDAAIRQSRHSGLGFSGGRLFPPLEGSGF
jgi:hypothetical protein